MSQIEHLHIMLNTRSTERLVFYAGETLSGKVYLKVREGFKVRAVKLVVSGEARVLWIEPSGAGKKKKRKTYTSTETYLSHEELLIYRLSDSELTLEPGEYSFSFKVFLPTMLPTSFETANGRIQYSARVTVDIPWDSLERYTHVSFTVINMLDLNYLPTLRHPFESTGAKQVGCGPFKQNPIDVKFSTNKTGFVSGEFVFFSVEINNRTGKKLKEANVQLRQRVRLHAEEVLSDKYKAKSRDIELGKLKCPVVKPNSLQKWNESIQIPAVCPSLKGISHIIEVDYFLLLNLKPGLFSLTKEFSIPLTIGTIPHRSSLESAVSTPPPAFTFDSGPLKLSSSLQHLAYSDKYEAIESNHLSYTPVYPYYKDLMKAP